MDFKITFTARELEGHADLLADAMLSRLNMAVNDFPSPDCLVDLQAAIAAAEHLSQFLNRAGMAFPIVAVDQVVSNDETEDQAGLRATLAARSARKVTQFPGLGPRSRVLEPSPDDAA